MLMAGALWHHGLSSPFPPPPVDDIPRDHVMIDE